MLLPLFVSTTSPVLVWEEGHKSTKSRTCRIFLKPDTNTLADPVFCKVKRRRKKPKADTTLTNNNTSEPGVKLDFPFLREPHTVKAIKQSKVLFIMRGLPGSGKSTIVKAITKVFQHSVVCSADDYFYRGGEYKFDMAGLGSAHEACQSKAKDACNAGVPVVVVDNTNVKRWEMKFYLELAGHRDYVVVLVQPDTPWRFNPEELAARNSHGVDLDTLKRKVSQFDNVTPLYYGWFLNETASKRLSLIAEQLLTECAGLFPDFMERLLKQIHVSPAELRQMQKNSADASPISDTFMDILKGYYRRGKRSGCLVHCTAKFCMQGKAFGAKTYHARPVVQKSVGQAFMLEIPSICFSPRTIGARVKLSDSQLTLFDKPEEKEWNGRQPSSTTSSTGAARASNGAAAGFRGKENSHGPSKSKGKQGKDGKKKSPKSKPEESVPTEVQPSRPFTKNMEPSFTKPLAKEYARSAHVTVGCGPGFESRETNFDMLRLCDMEAGSFACEDDFVAVTGGKARYFDDGVCCVYFDTPLMVNTIYSGYY